ncbi:hypothetical protein [Streptomyces sp. YPW6]|uniref:hypothetical protein n=1 Tax=Streptomyces sp. YPW6 TaxID=2840373 RepID=UPI003D71D931
MTNTPDTARCNENDGCLSDEENRIPDAAWWNNNDTPDARTRDFVDMAMDQVEGCRDSLVAGKDIPGVLRVACIESFWVNVRLLVEFLVKLTHDSRNADARALVPDWQKPTGDTADRLLKDWNTASAHVMHFANERAPEDLADIDPITDEDLKRVARDVRTVYDQFCQAADARH